MLRVDPELQYNSPTTIHLILVSSIIICVALWQFHSPHDSASRLLPPQTPVLLSSSAASHLNVLKRLYRPFYMTDGKLYEAVYLILKHVHHESGEFDSSAISEALFTLAHYRWCGSGTGIIASTDEAALIGLGLDRFPAPHGISLPSVATVNDIAGRRAAIEALCRADARVSTSDCFDLNIRFLPSLRRRSGDSLNPPVMSVGFRLNCVDNRLLRKGTYALHHVYRCTHTFLDDLNSL